MPGSTPFGTRQGYRSEILADYLLSGWGTVTPVRRSDDFGVDLACTLTERVGRMEYIREYYSVQVKSTSDPWVLEGEEALRWLLDHPTPLFLAHVDKSESQLAIYHTMPRFLQRFTPSNGRIELVPTSDDEGTFIGWSESGTFSLSAPIIRVRIEDLADPVRLNRLQSVLNAWVKLDRYNCTLRRMGILRFRMPSRYVVNDTSWQGIGEMGSLRPNPVQMSEAVAWLSVALDAIGTQFSTLGEGRAALLSALLLSEVRSRIGRPDPTEIGAGVADGAMPFPHELEMSRRLAAAVKVMLPHPSAIADLANVAAQFNAIPEVCQLLAGPQRP